MQHISTKLHQFRAVRQTHKHTDTTKNNTCLQHSWCTGDIIFNRNVTEKQPTCALFIHKSTMFRWLTYTVHAEHARQVLWWHGRASADFGWYYRLLSLACLQHPNDRCTRCQQGPPALQSQPLHAASSISYQHIRHTISCLNLWLNSQLTDELASGVLNLSVSTLTYQNC